MRYGRAGAEVRGRRCPGERGPSRRRGGPGPGAWSALSSQTDRQVIGLAHTTFSYQRTICARSDRLRSTLTLPAAGRTTAPCAGTAIYVEREDPERTWSAARVPPESGS